jgi:hypothetical protein
MTSRMSYEERGPTTDIHTRCIIRDKECAVAREIGNDKCE